MKEVIVMAIESDAQGDLALEPDDAENVAGGKTTKAPKTATTPGRLPGAQPEEPAEPKRSIEGLESHA
jgi:hypothetical protein